jgi:hypothetical protein
MMHSSSSRGDIIHLVGVVDVLPVLSVQYDGTETKTLTKNLLVELPVASIMGYLRSSGQFMADHLGQLLLLLKGNRDAAIH